MELAVQTREDFSKTSFLRAIERGQRESDSEGGLKKTGSEKMLFALARHTVVSALELTHSSKEPVEAM